MSDDISIVPDKVLLDQKDELIKQIFHLAELQTKSLGMDKILLPDEYHHTYDMVTWTRISIQKQLELIKPLWEVCSYGYKHTELTELFERALNVKDDGTW